MGPVDPSVEHPGKKFTQLYNVSFIFSCKDLLLLLLLLLLLRSLLLYQ